jgi:hypothetical protein
MKETILPFSPFDKREEQTLEQVKEEIRQGKERMIKSYNEQKSHCEQFKVGMNIEYDGKIYVIESIGQEDYYSQYDDSCILRHESSGYGFQESLYVLDKDDIV